MSQLFMAKLIRRKDGKLTESQSFEEPPWDFAD
jgi:hypothetical protein